MWPWLGVGRSSQLWTYRIPHCPFKASGEEEEERRGGREGGEERRGEREEEEATEEILGISEPPTKACLAPREPRGPLNVSARAC